jgi:dienelactone hydrolase
VTVRTRTIEYSDGGKTFEGFLAWNDAHRGRRPGVIIGHAWGGAAEVEFDKARALAELGYPGFCIDLYGKGIRGQSAEQNAKLMQPLLDDRALLQRRMKRGLEVAREQAEVDPARVAGIGFCFGGLCILDLARTGADLKGVVSFHGLFYPPGNTQGVKIKAKVLALHGWNDPMVKPELVTALAEELTGAGADWQIHAYGHTMHAFTNPQASAPEHGLQYNPVADRRSWQAMRNFFEELFPAG